MKKKICTTPKKTCQLIRRAGERIQKRNVVSEHNRQQMVIDVKGKKLLV